MPQGPPSAPYRQWAARPRQPPRSPTWQRWAATLACLAALALAAVVAVWSVPDTEPVDCERVGDPELCTYYPSTSSTAAPSTGPRPRRA